MFGKKMLPDSVKRAMNSLVRGTGPGLPIPPDGKEISPSAPANSPLILQRRYPSLPPTKNPTLTGVRNEFRVPLPLMNEAMGWVQTLFYTVPMARAGAATSFPAAPMPGMIAPPAGVTELYGAELNLQQAIGTVGIQATELNAEAENYG